MLDKDLRARQAVLEMGRVELEDKHLGLLEENFVSNRKYLTTFLFRRTRVISCAGGVTFLALGMFAACAPSRDMGPVPLVQFF